MFINVTITPSTKSNYQPIHKAGKLILKNSDNNSLNKIKPSTVVCDNNSLNKIKPSTKYSIRYVATAVRDNNSLNKIKLSTKHINNIYFTRPCDNNSLNKIKLSTRYIGTDGDRLRVTITPSTKSNYQLLLSWSAYHQNRCDNNSLNKIKLSTRLLMIPLKK